MSIRSIRRAIDRREQPKRELARLAEQEKARREARLRDLDRLISERKPGRFAKKPWKETKRTCSGIGMLSLAFAVSAMPWGSSKINQPHHTPTP